MKTDIYFNGNCTTLFGSHSGSKAEAKNRNSIRRQIKNFILANGGDMNTVTEYVSKLNKGEFLGSKEQLISTYAQTFRQMNPNPYFRKIYYYYLEKGIDETQKEFTDTSVPEVIDEIENPSFFGVPNEILEDCKEIYFKSLNRIRA
jgi:hypothetical protein